MDNQIRVVVLWILLVICMILHFDYHVSELFYGIDIKRPDANGTVPATILLIRSAFHFLPMLYAVVLLWWSARSARTICLLLSFIYTLANAAHFAGELKKADNPSQMVLLGMTLVISIVLIAASWQWRKQNVHAI